MDEAADDLDGWVGEWLEGELWSVWITDVT